MKIVAIAGESIYISVIEKSIYDDDTTSSNK